MGPEAHRGMSSSSPAPRSRLFRAAAGLAVAAVVLALAELGLRLALGPPPPPLKVYRVVGQTDQYLVPTGDLLAPTYEDVMPIEPFAPRAEGRRFAALGGSSVHVGGMNVTTEQEFPALLGEALGVEALNLGAPGIDSFDIVQIVQELEEVSLDALVVYTGHNDLGNVLFQERYSELSSRLLVQTLPWLEHLQLFCQVRRAITRPDGRPRVKGIESLRPEQPRLDPVRRGIAIRHYATNLERVAWLCQQRDLPLVVVVPVCDLVRPPAQQPCSGEDCPDELHARGLAASQTDREEGARLLREARDRDQTIMRADGTMEDVVRAMQGQPGVTVVDAPWELPRDEAADVPATDLFVDHIHLSVAGHAAMAELLEPALGAALGPAPSLSPPQP